METDLSSRRQGPRDRRKHDRGTPDRRRDVPKQLSVSKLAIAALLAVALAALLWGVLL